MQIFKNIFTLILDGSATEGEGCKCYFLPSIELIE